MDKHQQYALVLSYRLIDSASIIMSAFHDVAKWEQTAEQAEVVDSYREMLADALALYDETDPVLH